jgi:hypothetical protein
MSNDIRYDSRVEWIYYHGEKTVCVINEYGNVWNIKTGKLLTYAKDKYDNDIVLIPNIDSTRRYRNLKVSYTVARTFIPNPYEFRYVNHKDGNKDNHHISNLEWSFAYSKKSYSDLELHKICKLMEKGYTDVQIAIELGYNIGFLPYMIKSIPDRWYEIRSQYNIKRQYIRNTESDIHRVCKLLEDGRSLVDISAETGIKTSMIGKIKDGVNWANISSLYNIPNPNKERSIYVTHKKEIMEALQCGITDAGNILDLLNIPDSKKNRKAISIIKQKLKKEKVQRLSQ